MAHGIRVVGIELVHDFSREATNLAVLVGEPGAGTSRVDEQVDLSRPARHAGLRDVWVAPVGFKLPEPLASSNPQG